MNLTFENEKRELRDAYLQVATVEGADVRYTDDGMLELTPKDGTNDISVTYVLTYVID